MKTYLLTGIVICFLSTASLFAQVENFREDVSKRGTTAASFLEIGVGARPLALGGAYTALADDPSAIYWNVAGIAKMKQSGLFFNHSEWIADTNFDFLAGAFRLGRWGSVGFSITALTMDEMDVTTVDAPEGTGQKFRAGDYAVSLAYAFNLTDRFAIGFNPKVIYQFIWEMNALGIATDVGVHYKTPFPGVTLGFSMTNFGSDMTMSGDNNRVLYDLVPGSSGNNERLPAILETNGFGLPLNFKIGLLYNYKFSENNQALFVIDAQHPNNDYESVNLGAEFLLGKFFALRGGYRALFLDTAEESFTLGAGLNYPLLGNLMIHIDYAYADFGILENIQKFSIGIDF